MAAFAAALGGLFHRTQPDLDQRWNPHLLSLRVFHIQKATDVGGCERHLLALLPRLEAIGVTVRVCVLKAGNGERFIDALRSRRVDVVELPAGPDINVRSIPRLLREMRRFHPSLVHSHLIHGDLYGQLAARLAGIPGLSTVHATHAFYVQQPYRALSRAAWHHCRRVIAISNWIRDFLCGHGLVPTERVSVIHYGIDTEEWRPQPGRREQSRERLGIGPRELAIGVASRLVRDKGHSFLLDGFRRALPELQSTRLWIAGDGPLAATLADQARRELPPGAVRFLGFVEDMRSFIEACDLFVFPTMPQFGEGFGLAALEAMASGRPIIATRVGPLPEVLGEESGILVEPHDPDGLARALVLLAHDHDLRGRSGERSRGRATESFGVDAMVARVRDLYAEVSAERAASSTR